MQLNNFSPKYQENQSNRLGKRILKFQQLLKALSEREISVSPLQSINEEIDKVNEAQSEKLFDAQIHKSFKEILKIAEKQQNLVAKDHYRNMWLAVGMSAFGIPLGVAFGAALGNYGFIGIGLPIGFSIGIAIGIKKDKEAFEEGRQLDVDL